MVTLDDIQRLVMNYGNDILDDERRAHAIICNWHPRETVRRYLVLVGSERKVSGRV